MQILTWLMAAAICMICFIGTNLVVMDGFFISDIIHAIVFPPLIERLILQAVAFGAITACLTFSYIYFVHKYANKARVRLVYAIVGLLVAVTFVLTEYNYQQEKLTIRDVCNQFDFAIELKDYETAYELMSPNYRQTHSLAQFIAGEGSTLKCGYPYNRPEFSKNVRILLLHSNAREASVIHTPFGSLNQEIILEQVDNKWYLTGEIRHFIG